MPNFQLSSNFRLSSNFVPNFVSLLFPIELHSLGLRITFIFAAILSTTCTSSCVQFLDTPPIASAATAPSILSLCQSPALFQLKYLLQCLRSLPRSGVLLQLQYLCSTCYCYQCQHSCCTSAATAPVSVDPVSADHGPSRFRDSPPHPRHR